MNKEKSCRLDAAGKNAEVLSPAAAATLKFFYDINFKDPAKAAKYIAYMCLGWHGAVTLQYAFLPCR